MASQNPLHLNPFPWSADRVTAGVEWGLGAGSRLIKGLQRLRCAVKIRDNVRRLLDARSFIFAR